MASLLPELPETVTPTEAETRVAGKSSKQLARLLGKRRGTLKIRVENDDADEPIAIPMSVARLLSGALSEMSKGNAVTLIPSHSELTTQQAAEILNVSRPFLIEQLEKGLIPFRKVGSHRRVRIRDLLKYKRTMDRNRLKALEDLSALDQQLGLGY